MTDLYILSQFLQYASNFLKYMKIATEMVGYRQIGADFVKAQ